jgi:hypothetical protein
MNLILQMRLRTTAARWLALIGFLLTWLALFTGAAYASDCPPDDPSRSDCKSAASTARNPLVPIAGAVLGGAAGQVIGQVLTGGGKGETAGDDGDKGEGKAANAEPENPCLEALERFQLAKVEQEALFDAFLSWQSTVRSLDEMYWKTSKAGYWSGVVDIGFLAGSVFGRPLAGVSETLGKNT